MSTLYKFLLGIMVLCVGWISIVESSEISRKEKDGNIGHVSYEHYDLDEIGSHIEPTILFSLGGGLTLAGLAARMCLPFGG